MASETSKVRDEVVDFCVGCGIDLGCGGDKVVPGAIGFDSPLQYTKVGDDEPDLRGDARYLPFKDNTFDYVYSSHLLEDFPNTFEVLEEWTRVLAVGGNLIIYCPHEKIYRNHCRQTGQPYNGAHSIKEMSLEYIIRVAEPLPLEVVKAIQHHEIYSFLVIFRKVAE